MTFEDLGREIREKREAAGLSIGAVAARIKVSGRTLEAIEAGAFDSLPHAVYTKGFIRSFGQVVGFDPKELSDKLDEVFSEDLLDNAKPEIALHVRSAANPGKARRLLLLLFFFAIIGGIGAGGWFLVSNYGQTALDFVKQPFSAITTPDSEDERTAEEAPAPLQSSPEQSAQDALPETGSVETPGDAAAEPGGPPGSLAEQLGPAAPPEAGTEAAPDADPLAATGTEPPQAALSADGMQELVLTARGECWIRYTLDGVINPNNHFTLYPGQQRAFSFKRSLSLYLGNAGGVRVTLNGEDKGIQGQPGEVKTVIFP